MQPIFANFETFVFFRKFFEQNFDFSLMIDPDVGSPLLLCE